MRIPFMRKTDGAAAEIAALQRQLECARLRITELTLDNIQKANEIVMLKDYRGMPSGTPRLIRAAGKERTMPAIPANSEIGRLVQAC